MDAASRGEHEACGVRCPARRQEGLAPLFAVPLCRDVLPARRRDTAAASLTYVRQAAALHMSCAAGRMPAMGGVAARI